MKLKVRLLHWLDRDMEEWTAIFDRCRCGEVSRVVNYSDGRRAVLPGIPDFTERARALCHHRRVRRRAFGDDAALFHEPPWDILLELYIYGTDGPGLASSSIAYAIDVPISTTLRWIRSLEERTLVATTIDAMDARIRRVRLTERAACIMTDYLSGV